MTSELVGLSFGRGKGQALDGRPLSAPKPATGPRIPRTSAPGWRITSTVLSGLTLLCDAAALGLAAVVFAAWTGAANWLAAGLAALAVLYVMVAWAGGHYSLQALRPAPWHAAAWCMIIPAVLALPVVAIAARPQVWDAAAAWLGWAAVGAAFLGAGRVLLSRFAAAQSRRGGLGLRIAVYGAGPGAACAMKALFRHGAEAGLVPAGRYADEAPADPAGTGEEGEVVGGLAGLVHAVAVNRVDGVVVALDDHDLPAVATVTTALRDLVVDVWLLPDPEGPTRWLAAEELAPGLSVLPVWRKPLRDWRAVAKRTEDLVLGSILFVAFLPVMLVCAALLVTAGPGPVVLRQRRYGYGSTPFMMYKFRTMRYNPADQSEALATVKGDKRVTRVGRFLRSSSLDELPQLLNVLRGEMSLVGPRPHIIEMTVQGRLYEHMVPEYLSRHRVKPGITGLAQIGGYRGLVDSQEKAQRRVDLDLRYVETWSVGLDLRILWRTIFKGFVSPGAY